MISYGPESIDEDFRKAHSEILSVKRGNGLWLWKPYVILNALERVSNGDYVFYCDSGAFFFSSVMPLIQSMNDCDVWVSDISMVEEQWTKPEVFRLLGIDDREDIKHSRQIQASFVLCRKSEQSLSFIREWLSLCVRPELIMPLQAGEYKGTCIEHREDQSLFSVACKLHSIVPHKSPSISPPVVCRKKEISHETVIYIHRIRTAHFMAEFIVKLFLISVLSTSFTQRLVKLYHTLSGVFRK